MKLLPLTRIGLYLCLFLFSFILFALCAARIHYTTHLSDHNDALRNGVDFYDPIVAELLFTTLVTMPWALYAAFLIYRTVEPSNRILEKSTTFLGESVVLSLLWLFWIVGASVSTDNWSSAIVWCRDYYSACRLLSALLAFAWLGWITLTLLLIVNVLFALSNKAWHEPLHGQWDPNISHVHNLEPKP